MESLVENCKDLRELRLKEIGEMNDEFLEYLNRLSGKLTYLDISDPGHPEALSNDALVDMMAAIGRNLEHLDLSGNTLLLDGFLYQGLKPHARRLHTLVLSNTPELTDAGVAEFFDTWAGAVDEPNPPLAIIDMSRNHELSGKALSSLLKHSGEALEDLNINGWKATPEEDLGKIGSMTPKLMKVNLGWCREATDWTVKALLENCSCLQEVKVWGCQRVTERCPRKVSYWAILRLCTMALTLLPQRNVKILGIETQSYV